MTRREGASAPKHTPGPWHYYPIWPGIVASATPPKPDDFLDDDFDDKVIFDLQSAVGGGDKETRRANARLIAAAPELLDALRQGLEEFLYVLSGEMGEASANSDPTVVKMREAIAKAEGGEA